MNGLETFYHQTSRTRRQVPEDKSHYSHTDTGGWQGCVLQHRDQGEGLLIFHLSTQSYQRNTNTSWSTITKNNFVTYFVSVSPSSVVKQKDSLQFLLP